MSYPELSRMRTSDISAALVDTSETISKARSEAEVLIKRLSNEEISLNIENSLLAADMGNKYVNTTARSVRDGVFNAIRECAKQLYKLSSNVVCFNFSDSDEELCEIYRKEFVPIDGVEIYLEDRGIFLKLPMLWSRNNRPVKGAYNRAIGPRHAVCFKDSIQYALRFSENFDSYPFKKFADKLVCGLYVYRDIPNAQSRIIDNDNHDTKAVVDALVSFLPGNDSAMCCDFFYTAAISDAIPEGSYFTVTEKNRPIKKEEIIDFWKEKINQKI